MSSALDQIVLVFTSSNWQQWHTTMQAYLRAQGQWFVYSVKIIHKKALVPSVRD